MDVVNPRCVYMHPTTNITCPITAGYGGLPSWLSLSRVRVRVRVRARVRVRVRMRMRMRVRVRVRALVSA